MSHSITVKTLSEAWNLANQLFPSDYEKDAECSERAGYPIYRSTSKVLKNAWYNYICDLGNRLELNLCGENWESTTININFETREEPATAKEEKPAETTKILYIGLNDQNSKRQEISTIDAFKIVSRVLREKCGGATITQATGIYTHEDGTIVEETTLRCEIFGATLETVTEAAKMLKLILNQESIALSEVVTKSTFI